MLASACASEPGGGDATNGSGATASAQGSVRGESGRSFAFTDADLDAYERGLRKEIELVKAAQARSATSAEARRAAFTEVLPERTIPEAARSIGVDEDRYRRVRESVDYVLTTLDFQGKIDGPRSMDTTRADEATKQRLRGDAFADLPPESAAALRARLDRLTPVWSEYVSLTSVGG